MPYKTPAIVLGFAASAVLAAAAFAQEMQAPSMPADLARMAQSAAQKMQAPSMPADLARMAESAQTRMAQSAQSRYLPEYTASGDTEVTTELYMARMGLCRLAIDTQRAQWWPRRLP